MGMHNFFFFFEKRLHIRIKRVLILFYGKFLGHKKIVHTFFYHEIDINSGSISLPLTICHIMSCDKSYEFFCVPNITIILYKKCSKHMTSQ